MAKKEAILDRLRMPVAAVAVGVGALAFAGCSGSESDGTPSRSDSPVATSTPNSTPSKSPNKDKGVAPDLVFDGLDDNSGVIDVYPGVSPNQRDKTKNGTYLDDQRVTPKCKIEGREISSVPPEAERTSSEWVFFRDDNKVGHYATTVYVENPKQLLAALPEC